MSPYLRTLAYSTILAFNPGGFAYKPPFADYRVEVSWNKNWWGSEYIDVKKVRGRYCFEKEVLPPCPTK